MAGSTARVTFAAGYGEDGQADPQILAEARESARRARTAIVVVGLPGSYEVEGADRDHLDLPPGHNELVEAILAVQPRTVVVLVAGSAVALPWATRAPSIISAWLGGQASGGAIVDVLLGLVNPSGKLAETFPARLEDTPAYLSFPDDGTHRVTFSEGLFNGYRWYDARRIEPLFPFGHGLSYTTFSYGDLTVDQPATAEIRSGDHMVTVAITVRNTGSRPGMEVVQLYVGEQRPRLQRPEKELKAFAKVALDPGEAKVVRFALGARDFSVYDPDASRWAITSDTFDLLVGASSRDIRLRERVTLAGFVAERVSLGRLSPLRDWLAHPATRDRVRAVIGALFRQFFGADAELPPEGVNTADDIPSFMSNMPITKLVMFGVLSEADLEQLIAAVNGHITSTAIHQAPG
jgi:beta-glucosidase